MLAEKNGASLALTPVRRSLHPKQVQAGKSLPKVAIHFNCRAGSGGEPLLEEEAERCLLSSACTMPLLGEERALPRLFDPGIAREGRNPPPRSPPLGGGPYREDISPMKY